MSDSPPRISVVIPTYKRPELLLRCLRAVLSQRQVDARDYEVVVVDDGHDDATRDAVQQIAARGDGLPVVRYLRPPQGRGPAVARNAGWRAARGELLAFTDDDTIPSLDWLAEGERELRAHPAWVALCGRVVVPVAPPPTDHARMTQGLATAEFVTANAFVRRHAMETVGGFDERFLRAWREDSDLQFRLMEQAGPVGRSPIAEVVHPVRAAPWGLSLSQQRNTFFDALLYKKHPERYRTSIRPVPPWSYYATVLLTALSIVLLVAGQGIAAGVAAIGVAVLVLRFAWQRLRHTSHDAGHVIEMLCTSALIPFLSVYWRLRGALHFRVLFL
ncbi:glycosyltransferase family 2 protein [Piscinibacter sp. HJYY11]|uniref:glycosyltransferase family 2 protein n=1 Tax=Piscinibacter sp. HJYY11 TaxID=2801333 RepID=UPI0019201868|nr:glycosyltransferase [Piscinibacter sp. HJYY11]MBL0727184.1 glycosyltransferase [Piscinibacter sp. HJYY11]